MSKSDEFKVEELEQRLEMGKWSASASGSLGCTSGDCNGRVNAGLNYSF